MAQVRATTVPALPDMTRIGQHLLRQQLTAWVATRWIARVAKTVTDGPPKNGGFDNTRQWTNWAGGPNGSIGGEAPAGGQKGVAFGGGGKRSTRPSRPRGAGPAEETAFFRRPPAAGRTRRARNPRPPRAP